jgi:hypothetical protein
MLESPIIIRVGGGAKIHKKEQWNFFESTILFCKLQSSSGISRTGNFLFPHFPNIIGALDDCSVNAAMVKYMI